MSAVAERFMRSKRSTRFEVTRLRAPWRSETGPFLPALRPLLAGAGADLLAL
jgi:hypothetical protein